MLHKNIETRNRVTEALVASHHKVSNLNRIFKEQLTGYVSWKDPYVERIHKQEGYMKQCKQQKQDITEVSDSIYSK